MTRCTRRGFLKWAASAAVVSTHLGGIVASQREAEAVVPCNVPVNNPRGPSKLGFHLVGGMGMGNYYRQLRDAGTYFAVIKAADAFGEAMAAKQYTPQTVTVGRRVANDWFEDTGNPLREAEVRMRYHMSYWDKNQDAIDYWEVLNEPSPPGIVGHVRLGEFYMKCMEIAERHGYKLAILSYPVGVPTWDQFEALVKLGVFEMAKAGGHVLALHEYNWVSQCRGWGTALAGHPAYPDRGTLTGRYRWWYRDFLIPLNQVLPLVITEGGYDGILARPEDGDWDWRDHYMDGGGVGLPWIDDRLREDDYVIGTALFTVGDWEDPYEYRANEVQTITNYVISMKNA